MGKIQGPHPSSQVVVCLSWLEMVCSFHLCFRLLERIELANTAPSMLQALFKEAAHRCLEKQFTDKFCEQGAMPSDPEFGERIYDDHAARWLNQIPAGSIDCPRFRLRMAVDAPQSQRGRLRCLANVPVLQRAPRHALPHDEGMRQGICDVPSTRR